MPTEPTVLLFEDNLMWSARLRQTLRAAGYACEMRKPSETLGEALAAIVNLADEATAADLIPKLQAAGIYVIAHAGHKEKERMQIGRDAGADYLATNSEITFKLPDILARIRQA